MREKLERIVQNIREHRGGLTVGYSITKILKNYNEIDPRLNKENQIEEIKKRLVFINNSYLYSLTVKPGSFLHEFRTAQVKVEYLLSKYEKTAYGWKEIYKLWKLSAILLGISRKGED